MMDGKFQKEKQRHRDFGKKAAKNAEPSRKSSSTKEGTEK